MASYNKYQKAGAKIKNILTPTARNVFTKIDDIGFYSSVRRIDGESTANFRNRVYSTHQRPGNATLNGLTDSICRELSLGHDYLINITVDRDTELNVNPKEITISASGINETINLIKTDTELEWTFPTVENVVNDLNNISGISATNPMEFSGLPAMLLETQSSYIRVFNEDIPPHYFWELGIGDDKRPIDGKVIESTISFNNEIVFKTKVSGTPQAQGEWSVNPDTNKIQNYTLPPPASVVQYTWNSLTSGNTIGLIGNGVKILNLMDPSIHSILFYSGSLGSTGKEIINELAHVDRLAWGK